MVTILDGRATTEKVMEEVGIELEALKTRNITPGLALILTGTDKYSTRYVKLKKKRAEKLGMYAELHHLEDPTQKDLEDLIHRLNKDTKIHGIMVQLPLNEGLDELGAVNSINPKKDVDGLSPNTLGKILMGEEAYPPAGVAAIIELFKRYDLDPDHKHWVVIGSSNFLSKPLVAYLLNMKIRVTWASENCPHVPELLKNADVISTEIFKKHFVKSHMLKKGVIVIDNGNTYEGKKVFGDVDTEEVSKIASAITPVPGGTGPILIAMLLKATVQAASK